MLRALVLLPLALYAVVCVGMYFFQRHILFLPDTTRPQHAAVGVRGLREIELIAEDGVHLLAWYLPAQPGRPTLAYFHGNGGNLANRAPRIRRFAEAGLGVLMPEYRGYGGNPAAPSEAGFALDARAAMAFLAAQGVPTTRTVVYGESIGTGVAVRVAAGQEVAALILESPYTSITAIARRRFWFLPVGLLLRDPFDSLSRIARVHAPLLVLQGARDTIVAPELGRALFAAAPEPKEIWIAPDGRHNDLMQHGLFEAVAGFIDRRVPPGSPATRP